MAYSLSVSNRGSAPLTSLHTTQDRVQPLGDSTKILGKVEIFLVLQMRSSKFQRQNTLLIPFFLPLGFELVRTKSGNKISITRSEQLFSRYPRSKNSRIRQDDTSRSSDRVTVRHNSLPGATRSQLPHSHWFGVLSMFECHSLQERRSQQQILRALLGGHQ